MICTSLAVSCLAVLAVPALAKPSVSKTVIIDKQVPANNEILGSLGASASWGPYSAGAGLGGSGGGGGLSAGASSPHGTAGAGLGGGSSASAGASASASGGVSGGATTGAGATASGGKPHTGATFFDRIFNIPISILQSVNSNLNANGRIIPHHQRYIPVQGPLDDQHIHEYVRIGKRGNVRKRVYVKGEVGGNAGGSAQAAPAPSAPASSASASASASAGAGADGAPASAGHANAQAGVQKNYDAVFNIPITALRSVNEFLNGK